MATGTETGSARLSIWMAAVAFILSTANGAFTLYDQMWRAPVRQHKADVAEFETSIQQIEAINQANIALGNAAGEVAPNAQVQDSGYAADMRKQILLANAMRLLPMVSDSVTSTEYTVLASEQEHFQNLPTALQLLNSAVGVAQRGYPKSEALRERAQVEMQMGIFDAAIRNLDQALVEAGDPSLAFQRATIFGTRIGLELRRGRCEDINPLLVQFVRVLHAQEMDVSERGNQYQYMRSYLQRQDRCQWDQSLLPG